MGAWTVPVWSFALLVGWVGLVAWRVSDIRHGARVGVSTWSPFWVGMIVAVAGYAGTSLAYASLIDAEAQRGIATAARGGLTVCLAWGYAWRVLAWWERH